MAPPSNQTKTSADTTANDDTREELQLTVPTPDDFATLAEMKHLAFSEKKPFWRTERDNTQLHLHGYMDMATTAPQKLTHCRVVKDETGRVIGACQLVLPGDPGDYGMPEWMHEAIQPGDCYVEFIACHPNATGRGIGSRLLAWADEYAVTQGARTISLEVMAANARAKRLYERKGYCVMPKEGGAVDQAVEGAIIWFFLGMKYTKALLMKKQLHNGGHSPAQAA